MSSKSCSVDTTTLHTIGRTQSCGYCLALQEDAGCSSGLRISSLSDNITQAPWIQSSTTSRMLVGKDLGHVFHADCVETVRSLVTRQKQVESPREDHVCLDVNRDTADIRPFRKIHAELHLPSADQKKGIQGWTCTVVGSDPGVYLLEVEPKISAEREACLLKVAYLLSGIPSGAAPQVIAAALGDAIGENLPEYDRVMVYRFGEDNTGDVIHESIRPGFENGSSYLNLRFPAADIPPAARELLKLNGVRFIADTSDPGVPVAVDERASTPLDLSRSAFRVASACHLRYLRNMGVKASLVVAIVVDDKLWGLCSCHSYTRTVHPSCEERFMVQLAATIIAALMSHSQRENVAMTSLSLSNTLDTLKGYRRVQDFLSAEHKALRSIVGADTIVLCECSRFVTVYGNEGIRLTLEECEDLLRAKGSGDALLFRVIKGKGVAFFSVRSFLVAFLRGNVTTEVRWAGKPDPPVHDEEGLHPRASFDAYVQMVEGKIKPWSPETMKMLGTLRRRVSSFIFGEILPADLEEAFAYMSHELRTPFHGVLGALEILESEQGTIGADEKLDTIRSALRCSESMMSTLDEIANIAEDKNHKVAQEYFAAATPILITMAALKPFAAIESIYLVSDIPQAAAGRGVVGDVRRIKAVVQNLVNNAIKFTPSGGTVHVSLIAFDSLQKATDWWAGECDRFDSNAWMVCPSEYDDGVYKAGDDFGDEGAAAAAASGSIPLPQTAKMWYVYCVQDSGVGVLPSDVPHIGDPYTQRSAGASRLYSGTGLGLHISKGHMSIMSGGIGVASNASMGAQDTRGGTLFAVFLPLRSATVPSRELTPGTGTSFLGSENIAQKARIAARKLVFLAVDDHPVNLKLIQRKIGLFLKKGGGDVRVDVQVRTAADGILAIDALMDVQNNLEGGDAMLAGIFLDIHMPNLDGIECTKRIREMESEKGWSRTFICGCSADPTQQTSDAFHAAGGDEVIYKPWNSGEVEGICTVMMAKALSEEGRRETVPGRA